MLCVLNPGAGGGLALRRWPRIAAALQGCGITCQLLAERDPPVGRQVADRLAAYMAVLEPLRSRVAT